MINILHKNTCKSKLFTFKKSLNNQYKIK